MQLTATAGLLALPACSFLEGLAEQGITETSGPNGRLAYVIECDEFGREVADCFAAAGDLCPTGYDVIDRVSRVMTDTDIDGNVSSFEDNSLFIECK
ncbi:MAG: hypothetical protein AAFQ36_12275 [Pseudomonadota bacterium]